MTLPKPDARITPSQDEFDAWAEHPVTRFVAAAHEAAAEAVRQEWIDASWGASILDQNMLTRNQTRADAYQAFSTTGLEDYARFLESEDRQPRKDRRSAPRSRPATG